MGVNPVWSDNKDQIPQGALTPAPPCSGQGSAVAPVRAPAWLQLTYSPGRKTKPQKCLCPMPAGPGRHLQGPCMSVPCSRNGCELVGLANVNEESCLITQRARLVGVFRSGEVRSDFQRRECPWQPAPGFLGDTALWREANVRSAWEWSPGENNATALHGDRALRTRASRHEWT